MQKRVFETPPRRVALFVTCMVDMMYPGVGIAATELLERQGIEVIFPLEQTCCGQPAFNAGYRDEARVLARRFLSVFGPLVENGSVDAIVAPSGSCVTMTSHFYQVLFEEVNDRAELHLAQRVAAATFELTEFLVDVLHVDQRLARLEGVVTYHPCCHLYRELGVDEQPRKLLANVEGAEFVELPEAEDCCGFGGLFAVKNDSISAAMGRRKVANLAKSGADVVALCDVSCMTHINGILRREGINCRAVHIAEILNGQLGSRLRPPEEPEPPRPDHPRRWQDPGLQEDQK
ncbi:MAG: (Fe-S)-binding protein [Caldilineae bacterium]|nr:MAG: (Fe-S)-binding protein [Caldilineae bacterium]